MFQKIIQALVSFGSALALCQVCVSSFGTGIASPAPEYGISRLSLRSPVDTLADSKRDTEIGLEISGSMGPVCWAAILESISEIGKRCVSDEDLAFRVAIDGDIARLDAKFIASGWTQVELERFKVQMGERDKPITSVCGNDDALKFYREMAKAEPFEIHKTTSAMLARPGRPEWGTCL